MLKALVRWVNTQSVKVKRSKALATHTAWCAIPSTTRSTDVCLPKKGFEELTHISEFFDTVEINVTFYLPIPARTSESWLQKDEKNKRFKFTGKLWQGFTHDRNAGAGDERMFKDGYAPLLEAGRLGAILLQFPWSFRNTAENRHYVARSSSDSIFSTVLRG